MIVTFVGLEEQEKQKTRKIFPDAKNAENIAGADRNSELLSVFINDRLSKKELGSFKKLKFVVTRSTGYDHMDIKECRKRGIVVYNVPDYGTETVAEYTMLLILALLRKLKKSESILSSNAKINPKQLQGNEASGKTLGVLGTGRIGIRIIALAKAFGMEIVAYDKFPNPRLSEHKVKRSKLEDVIKKSDIVTLHLPLTDETRHIIDKKSISKMKHGVLIINTARGGLIDIEALAAGLDSGKIGGAAMDVIEAEDLIIKENDVLQKPMENKKIRQAFIGNMLLQRDNVIITPHIAYNTEEAMARILKTTVETIKELEKGNAKLSNKVS